MPTFLNTTRSSQTRLYVIAFVAKSYTITVRLLVYHGTGLHRYFVNQDHSGFLIHSTTQDRPATNQ